MAIDASIYGQIQAPKENNLLAQYAQMQQIQGSQAQNRLADLMYGEKESAINRSRSIDDAYRGAIGPDGVIDRQKLYSSIAENSGRELPAIQKGFAETDKNTREAEKARIEQQLQRFDVIGRITGGVTDQASYDRSKLEVAQFFGQDAAAKMPAAYDPQLIAENKTKAMTLQMQLEQQREDMKYSTPNANALLSAQTSRDNNASSAALTRRGQDMSQTTAMRGQDLTDVRGRDFNATKVEENLIKREAQDSASNLTKASQVASFDTMLGTLDRLGGHAGLSRSVGIVGALPTRPGSESANFQAELNTFQSQAFLPMVAQLKGMGALSDAEGKKLTAAVGALDPKMGEVAFRASVDRITADMQAARNRMIGIPKTGSVRDGYRFKGGNPADQNSWERM